MGLRHERNSKAQLTTDPMMQQLAGVSRKTCVDGMSAKMKQLNE